MKHTLFLTSVTTALAFAPMIVAQEIADDGPGAFTSANAILDTSIAFAPDARESQQNLRGSFGWATFQEGFADTVYFRFDPDGYARFSPSPRLDVDVFEVTCVPGTIACMAQKGPLSLHLTATGKLQMAFDDIQNNDRLMLFDGTNHLTLPDRFLGPLEPQFEDALSKGGDIEVYRGDMQVSKTSLKGLKAAVTYLRWIASQQSTAAFPPNWFGADPAAPQTVVASPSLSQDINSVAAGSQYAGLQSEDELSSLRAELETLKKLMLSPTAQNHAVATIDSPANVPTVTDPARSNDISFLQTEIENLTAELLRLRNQPEGNMDQQVQLDRFPDPIDPNHWRPTAPTPAAVATPMPPEALPDEVKHLQYLVSEMGLPPKTALVLMQFLRPDKENIAVPDQLSRTYHDSLATSILEDLEAELDASLENIAPIQDDISNGNISELPQMTAPHKKTTNTISLDIDPEELGLTQIPAKDMQVTDESPESVTADQANSGPVPIAHKVAVEEYQPLADYLKMAIEE